MLLQTLKFRGSEFCVFDYASASSSQEQGELITKLLQSVVGLASFYYAKSVLERGGKKLSFTHEQALDHLKSPFIDEKLSLENRAIQCFSVDPDHPDPPQFMSLVKKMRGRFSPSDWERHLLFMIDNRLSVSLKKCEGTDMFLSCVYEAVENTKKHGRLNKKREGEIELIPGPRYFSIKRHVKANYTKKSYIASGFNELSKYLEKKSTRSINQFLEVCISDGGQGIAAHFKAFSTDQDVSQMSDVELINFIAENNLSTDSSDESSGKGFMKMLKSIRLMDGFISIRCNNSWLYFYNEESETGHQFKNVHSQDNLSQVAGTHINILFPVILKKSR